MQDRIASFLQHAMNNEGKMVKLRKIKSQHSTKENNAERRRVMHGVVTALKLMGISFDHAEGSYFLKIIKEKQ